MAKKKKAPAAPPMQCFAGRSIAIIGGNIGQRKIWAAKTGCVEIRRQPSSSWPTTSTGRGKSTRARRSWRSRGSSSRSREARSRTPRRSARRRRVSPPPLARRAVAAAKRARSPSRRRGGLVVVAVGLPARASRPSTRSHLAALGVVHCCQDLTGRGRDVSRSSTTVRRAPASVDRCDGYPEQRAPWVEIAKRCKVEVVALRFTADASTCIQRAKARAAQGEHDSTLKSDFARVILKHRSEAEPIGEDEGFDRVYAASEDDDDANAALVDELLGRTPTAPTVEPAAAPSLPDTTAAIRAFTLAPADPLPRDVPGYDVDEPLHAKIVDSVITAADAARLIELAAGARDALTGEHGYRRADLDGRMQRDKRQSDRVMVDAPDLARQIFARLSAGLPATWRSRSGGLWRLKGLNERLRFLKYSQPGDFFYPHWDGCFVREVGVERSFVTVLLYLNEGCRGACTTIYDETGRPLPVAPRTGMALVHDHRVVLT